MRRTTVLRVEYEDRDGYNRDAEFWEHAIVNGQGQYRPPVINVQVEVVEHSDV